MDSGADILVGRAKVCRVLAFTVGAVVAALAAGILVGASAPANAAPASPSPGAVTPTVPAQPTVSLASAADPAGHWSFFNQYCEKCHNAEDWAGGVAFDTLTPADIPENADTLEKAVRKLRGHLMPPAGKPQPDPQLTREFVGWLETSLDQVAQDHPNPGKVALHRLNRSEYANAVRDLLDLPVDPAALLPKDDSQHGFDNVADALQVSPSFLDQYLSAARTVAVQAIGNRAARPAGASYVAKDTGTQQFYREGLPLGTRGGMVVDHYFPADGDYVMNIGNMAQALWVYNMEFENTVVVTVDGAQVYQTSIGGEADMKAIDQKQDPAVDAINARLQNIHFKGTAGYHKVGVAFVQRTFAESEDRLQANVPGGGQDRVLRVTNFEIRGPFNPSGISQTPSRARIFTCYPREPAEEETCARQILTRLAGEAYRRPVSDSDTKDLVTFYRRGRQSEDFDAGIRLALTAILASPDFLYRAEMPTATAVAGTTYRITDLELAARLSFFLWSTLPDDELLRVAARGELHDPEQLARQVQRMLADSKAQSLVTHFAFQWLNVAKLAEIEPDARLFPYASGPGDLREDFCTELRLFIDSVFREDRSVMDLLTADYTYVNERLALHYGIRDVKGDRFRRVHLTQSARYGLLGKGAVLMLTSYPTRTAPVLRGEWILDNITGTPPAAPPPAVPALKENEAGKTFHSIRELMESHRSKPNCFSCHGVLDPLGFALENFDATGKYRTLDRDTRAVIDASGKLPDGTQLRGPDDLRKALTARPEQFVQTMTEKMMTYALGRGIEYYDMPTIRAIVRDTGVAQDPRERYKFSAIVMRIIASDAFQESRSPSTVAMPLTAQAGAPQ
jgi:mono/diheme cytochrome c family protein